MDEVIRSTDEDEDWIKVVHDKRRQELADELGITVDELIELERRPAPSMDEIEAVEAEIKAKLKELGLEGLIETPEG